MSLALGLVQRVIVVLLGFYYAVVFCLGKILLDTIRLGPGKVFTSKKRNKPPACLEDPSLGTHGYVRLESIRMHYVSNGPEDKPLMLLVHGFPEFWYSWRHQLREFKDIYRVVAVDLRGYNETDKPPSVSDYTFRKLISDLKQVVVALGYTSCVLVGHDWGGSLAWAFTEVYPNLVSHLIVLNCPNPRVLQKHLFKSFTQFRKSWYMFFFQIPWLPELAMSVEDYAVLDHLLRSKTFGVTSSNLSDDDVEAYKYSFSHNGFKGPINFYRAAFSLDVLSQDPSEVLGSGSEFITAPTLILWGDPDGCLETCLAELSSKLCKGKVTVQVIKDASHWVQMDRPDLVNKYIRQFLMQ